MAVASAMEALPLQVQGDDEAWAQARHVTCDWGGVHGFGLDGAVNRAFPNVCGVSTV